MILPQGTWVVKGKRDWLMKVFTIRADTWIVKKGHENTAIHTYISPLQWKRDSEGFSHTSGIAFWILKRKIESEKGRHLCSGEHKWRPCVVIPILYPRNEPLGYSAIQHRISTEMDYLLLPVLDGNSNFTEPSCSFK